MTKGRPVLPAAILTENLYPSFVMLGLPQTSKANGNV